MSRLLLITEEESDLGRLLQKVFTEVTVLSSRARYADPNQYDAVCILGGTTDEGIVLTPPLRVCVDALRAQGKPMFCEFARSVVSSQIGGIFSTTHHRMVFADKDFSIPGLVTGDVLDGHENAYIRYGYVPDVYPILSCHEYVCAHSHIDMSEEEYKKGVPAMWKKDNLLVCSFRLCNFRRARLAPRRSFEALVAAVADIRTLDKEKLSSKRAGRPCAHFNSYYHAVLLLAYRAGGDKRYLEIAERGLAFLMSHYPETNRETSETEENCRLLFPLAVLYEITGKAEPYDWICRIMDYLDEHRHSCGAIPE